MPDKPSQKFLFVLNPVSGGKHKADWETGIRDFFKDSEHKHEIYTTVGKGDYESLKYWVGEWKPDKVIAVGGDGTLKLVAEVLLDSGVPVCIFPAGSANGMAREINMPYQLSECWEVLLNGEVKPTDIIRINGDQICLHLSDIGMNAQLVKYFEERNTRGKFGYARGVIKMLWKRRLMEVTISRTGSTLKRSAFMIVVANAGVYGTGVRINPIGDIHDGLFEVIIMRKLSMIELLKMMFLNRPLNPKKTEVLQAESLNIVVKKRAYFQIDGEYLGKTTSIEASMEKHALLLMFPKREETANN